jgi:hypothetical protein
VQLILAYIADKWAALFDAGTAWLSKIVLPAISTVVDELTAAGFYYSEPIGSAIMSAIGQVWNLAVTAAHGLGTAVSGGLGSGIKFVIKKIFAMVHKVTNAASAAAEKASGVVQALAALVPDWIWTTLKKVFETIWKGFTSKLDEMVGVQNSFSASLMAITGSKSSPSMRARTSVLSLQDHIRHHVHQDHAALQNLSTEVERDHEAELQKSLDDEHIRFDAEDGRFKLESSLFNAAMETNHARHLLAVPESNLSATFGHYNNKGNSSVTAMLHNSLHHLTTKLQNFSDTIGAHCQTERCVGMQKLAVTLIYTTDAMNTRDFSAKSNLERLADFVAVSNLEMMVRGEQLLASLTDESLGPRDTAEDVAQILHSGGHRGRKLLQIEEAVEQLRDAKREYKEKLEGAKAELAALKKQHPEASKELDKATEDLDTLDVDTHPETGLMPAEDDQTKQISEVTHGSQKQQGLNHVRSFFCLGCILRLEAFRTLFGTNIASGFTSCTHRWAPTMFMRRSKVCCIMQLHIM